MKRIFLIFSILYAFSVNAQTYQISFTGSGASTSVSTVKVENLTTGTTLTMKGSDVLLLTIATDINSVKDNQSSELKIYPNPMTDNSTLEIFPPVAGDAIITVYDINGKLLKQIQSKLDKGLQEFHLSGLKSGYYLISVTGSTYKFSGKLLCNSTLRGTFKIEKTINNQAVEEKKEKADSKGLQETVDMAYTTGDRLKFTGISGDYSTTGIAIPTSDLEIIFNFIACIDGDNNNYPIVEIGTQIWMAENMKTTRYLNGDLIGTTTPDTLDIQGESAPKYQWASNRDEINVATNGRLYTWYAVTDTRNVCPTGWHVPTDAEWTTLFYYLINNGYGFGGSGNLIAKSMAATSGWIAEVFSNPGDPFKDQASNNSSGFNAFPSGARNPGPIGTNGPRFAAFGQLVEMWSSTEYTSDPTYSWIIRFSSGSGNTYSGIRLKNMGLSVRCLLD
jgi:uncharacterized protein (TIGR02145 family)